jgi:regulator of sigma E protease
MLKPKGLLKRDTFCEGNARCKTDKYFSVFLLVIVFAAAVYIIVRNIDVFGNVALTVVGFGTMVIVHEFGHFIVAKLSGIKVEVFSIFMPPTLLGIQKTEEGFRFGILPKFFPKENGESDDSRLNFTVGKKGKAGETEYRIGLIPFGGFVKMLGQEDTKEVERSDDPRSYANKPVGVRMGVIAAGVFFNIISAAIVFMIVFLVGIRLTPAVVGRVVPGSPAARAGLKAGDEIIEIEGKSYNLDFMNVAEAAAFADVNEKVPMKVKHEDGSIEKFAVAAEQKTGVPIQSFGFYHPMSLTIANLGGGDAESLYSRTGLKPGDVVRAVNGKDVETYWAMEEVVQEALVPEVTILAERADAVSEKVESKIKLNLVAAEMEDGANIESGHICSMVPRLRVEAVSKKPLSIRERLMSLLSGKGKDKGIDRRGELQSGDIVLSVGDTDNPTYKELRDVTTQYEDKELPIRVLRSGSGGVEEELTIIITPKRLGDSNRVVIGIFSVFDAEHPVVAKTITAKGGPAALAIPRGAVITAVDGVGVSNFYDIIREVRKNFGERITIDYRVNDEVGGNVALDLSGKEDFIAVKSIFSEPVPFEYLERLYKASGPIDAIVMGYRKAVMFIKQAFTTLQRFLRGLVSPKDFMGPVGIITMSYRIVSEKPLVYYAYWLGLLSAFIGVFNALPLLPFDGGHIVFLFIEKVKGSPVSERVQGAVVYTGWLLVGAFALYVTFNDIVRSFFS